LYQEMKYGIPLLHDNNDLSNSVMRVFEITNTLH
jgi:hypothetical protein